MIFHPNLKTKRITTLIIILTQILSLATASVIRTKKFVKMIIDGNYTEYKLKNDYFVKDYKPIGFKPVWDEVQTFINLRTVKYTRET